VTLRSRPESLTAESRDSVIRLRVADGSFWFHSTDPSTGFGGKASVPAGRARPEVAGGHPSPKSGRQVTCFLH